MQTIYTIGHGNRKKEPFLTLLQANDIEIVLDVRSQPYSRFHPDFNRPVLEAYLKENGVLYRFFGDSLGGRPDCAACYHQDGRVHYEAIREQAFFKEGMNRLRALQAN